ncbi:hypothetical protein Tco_1145828, partial [Tanacetum coccineum]
YGPENSKQESNIVCDKKSDDSKENSDNSLVKEQISKDTSSFVGSSLNVDKETVFPVDKKVESVKPKVHEKPVKKSVRFTHNVNTAKAQAVNTAWSKTVKTARPNSVVVNVVRVNQANAVNASACWVWRPTEPDSASITLKKHNYIDARGRSKTSHNKMIQDFFYSGCSRHMTGNIAYLSDFKEFDGAEILKKFNYTDVKSASTPVDLEKPLVKDGDADDVDVHLYRFMIGSLMYLTASRPYIMFVVCACARFQVTPKTSHLLAVKRIFRYLKGKPTLGLWYSRDSPFELVAYTDSDYAGATQDRNSTTGGC